MNIEADLGPSDSLDRHESRRGSGSPIISVLSGRPELAREAAGRWARRQGRVTAEVANPRLGPMVDAWADKLATATDLREAVVARIANRMGLDAGALGGRLTRMGPAELGRFLESTRPDPAGDRVEAACGWILRESAREPGGVAPRLAEQLAGELPGRDGFEPAERVVAALMDLIAPRAGPILLVVPPPAGAEGASWLEEASRSLARLSLARPRLTALLSVAPDSLDAYLRRAPESREKALVRAGVVEVAGLDAQEIGRRLAASADRREGTTRRLAVDGASAGLMELFLEAASAALSVEGPETADRARSAAERFLFERLESLPATVGLFQLNLPLDIPFGPGRAMEVDLGSRALGLAIEIDGYYHFRDDDDYRRDRRKDFSLQRRGYLVVRVLAADVVRRLEDVLDLILEAVAARRGGGDGDLPSREPQA